MRAPAVAGQFYPSTKEELNKEIEASFRGKLGPGLPKVPFKKSKIKGLVVPHAGYQYSGQCAAHAFKELPNCWPELFVLLGPNHQGYAKVPFSLSLEDFETPFGVVENDRETGKELIKAGSSIGLQQDELAHKFEHSIEVQLPFLQFISKFIKKTFKIAPIVVSTISLTECQRLGKLIARILKEKKVCVIASSDFTHYGLSYGFVPFTSREAPQKLPKLDKEAIEYILNLDSKNFNEIATTRTTICGVGPITIAIEACKGLGASSARLLKYYTSGDLTKDYTSAVGYAAILIE